MPIFSATLIDGTVIVQDIDFFQVMTFTNLKVVGVVSRGNLYAARSELLVNILVRTSCRYWGSKKSTTGVSFAQNSSVTPAFIT